MSSNGSNDKNDRPDGEGVSRKRPFKSLAQDVSSTYSGGNNRSGSCDEDQINENIPEGLESMLDVWYQQLRKICRTGWIQYKMKTKN